jgi:hypothetical protein
MNDKDDEEYDYLWFDCAFEDDDDYKRIVGTEHNIHFHLGVIKRHDIKS